jgi:hypothetical protein
MAYIGKLKKKCAKKQRAELENLMKQMPSRSALENLAMLAGFSLHEEVRRAPVRLSATVGFIGHRERRALQKGPKRSFLTAHLRSAAGVRRR